MQDLLQCLEALPEGSADAKQQVHRAIADFVHTHEAPGSPFDPGFEERLRTVHSDGLAQLLAQSSQGSGSESQQQQQQQQMLLLKAVKVLARSNAFRKAAGPLLVASLLGVLSRLAAAEPAAEAANALLNLSHERRQVAAAVVAGGARTLLAALAHGQGAALRASVAGAVQSMSFQGPGRAALHESNCVPILASLLNNTTAIGEGSSTDGCAAAADIATMQQRLLGTMHNLSAHPPAARALVRAGALPAVCALLASAPATCLQQGRTGVSGSSGDPGLSLERLSISGGSGHDDGPGGSNASLGTELSGSTASASAPASAAAAAAGSGPTSAAAAARASVPLVTRASAVGVLQNVTRDAALRQAVWQQHRGEVLPALLDLVACEQSQVQVAACHTLLQLALPEEDLQAPTAAAGSSASVALDGCMALTFGSNTATPAVEAIQPKKNDLLAALGALVALGGARDCVREAMRD